MKDLLYSIIQPHLEQVSTLLNEYKYDKEFVKEDVRFIAIIIYLAGIDKLLSFTMIALWIAGRIKYKELKRSKNKNWFNISNLYFTPELFDHDFCMIARNRILTNCG